MSDAVPPSIWDRPVRGARGPQGELSRGQIAATAIELADSAGLQAVTMRAVGDGVGASAAGLYRYVRSRDELIALMVDVALADLTVPTPDGNWRAQLLAVAHVQLRVYVAHPWLVTAGLGSGPAGPNTLRYFDRCLAIMGPLPATNTAKMEALAMLTGVVSLFARAAAGERVDPAILFSGLDPARHPHLAAALGAAERPAATRDLFDRTIHSVLSGLLETGPDT